jgi:hypothetical protein
MCPACFATIAWIAAAGTTSTGAVAALVVSRFCGKNNKKDEQPEEMNKPKT